MDGPQRALHLRLHDGAGSELSWFENGHATWNSEDLPAGTLTLRLPVVQPDIVVPTVELFLK